MFRRKSDSRISRTWRLILLFSFQISGCGSAPEEPQHGEQIPSKTTQAEPFAETPNPQPPPIATESRQNPAPANLPLAAPGIHQDSTSEGSSFPDPKAVEFDQEIVAAFEKIITPGSSVEEWEQANQTLLGFGPAAIPLLAEKLKNGDEIEREAAASAIVSLGEAAETAIPELRAALQDTLPYVRMNAAVALIPFPKENEKAIHVLVSLLEHSDESVRQMATQNLSILGTEASNHVADLTRILEKSDGSDQLLPVVELLGRIGPAAEKAVPKLKQIAFKQKGELRAAANSAIELIQTNPK